MPSRDLQNLINILHEEEREELGELLLQNCPQFINNLENMSKKVIAKDLYKSRTIWLGVLALFTGLAWLFTGEPEFKEFLFVVMGALGIYLRIDTDQPIKK